MWLHCAQLTDDVHDVVKGVRTLFCGGGERGGASVTGVGVVKRNNDDLYQICCCRDMSIPPRWLGCPRKGKFIGGKLEILQRL